MPLCISQLPYQHKFDLASIFYTEQCGNSTSNTMESLRFYHVQVQDEAIKVNSFTTYNAQRGFEANASYSMAYCHWLNKAKIERHLDSHDRSQQPTPFISVFDNYGIAKPPK
jgi:hypothetical protein